MNIILIFSVMSKIWQPQAHTKFLCNAHLTSNSRICQRQQRTHRKNQTEGNKVHIPCLPNSPVLPMLQKIQCSDDIGLFSNSLSQVLFHEIFFSHIEYMHRIQYLIHLFQQFGNIILLRCRRKRIENQG